MEAHIPPLGVQCALACVVRQTDTWRLPTDIAGPGSHVAARLPQPEDGGKAGANLTIMIPAVE